MLKPPYVFTDFGALVLRVPIKVFINLGSFARRSFTLGRKDAYARPSMDVCLLESSDVTRVRASMSDSSVMLVVAGCIFSAFGSLSDAGTAYKAHQSFFNESVHTVNVPEALRVPLLPNFAHFENVIVAVVDHLP